MHRASNVREEGGPAPPLGRGAPLLTRVLLGMWAAPRQILRPGYAAAGVRIPRFVLVGMGCALAQLGLLQVLVQSGVQENLANLIAFGASVEINFAASQFYTWRDRWTAAPGPRSLLRRLFLFNASAATTGVVNQGVFGLANLVIWYLPAAALGIGSAAASNFLLNDRLVFCMPRSRRPSSASAPGRRQRRRPPTGQPP